MAHLPRVLVTSGALGARGVGGGGIFIVQTWTWHVVPESLSLNGLSGVVGK